MLSLIDQVTQFSESIATKPAYAPWTAENALFGVWIGVNDVGNSWWLEEYDALVEKIMDTYFGQLQVLYDAGARKFVLLSVPRKLPFFPPPSFFWWYILMMEIAIQRTPAVAANGPDVQAAGLVSINKYNAAIAARLATFKSVNTGVTATIVDTAVPFNQALDDPTTYGAPDALCYKEDGNSCLWFNDYHPGVAINKLVAEPVAEQWKGSFFK